MVAARFCRGRATACWSTCSSPAWRSRRCSNDATALLLTPMVYALVKRLPSLPALPFVLACHIRGRYRVDAATRQQSTQPDRAGGIPAPLARSFGTCCFRRLRPSLSTWRCSCCCSAPRCGIASTRPACRRLPARSASCDSFYVTSVALVALIRLYRRLGNRRARGAAGAGGRGGARVAGRAIRSTGDSCEARRISSGLIPFVAGMRCWCRPRDDRRVPTRPAGGWWPGGDSPLRTPAWPSPSAARPAEPMWSTTYR